VFRLLGRRASPPPSHGSFYPTFAMTSLVSHGQLRFRRVWRMSFPAPIACGAATVHSAALAYVTVQPEVSP